MKRILFALAFLALVLPAAPRAAAAEVSIDFFYNNLDDGSWLEVADYGYCWQPSVAVSNTSWRPYADGYWAYTDVGWTWVSYEDFGWATYHYGSWARLRDHGWVWVPGYEWGPAWVSWRTGGDYVGWAPLPPRRHRGGGEVVYAGRPITGYVDIEFDIGPAYYNFVDVRYIGAPVLREHIYAPTQNITYINQTVNVTNITYNNSVVYNYGPDYNRLSAYSTRPIQRLTLQRQTDADFAAGAQSGHLTKVQGNTLLVAAPQRVQKPPRPVAPKVVKTKIQEPNIETGWTGISDPKAKAQLQEKMKKEDLKTVPPPKIAPTNPAALSAASPSPAAGSSPPAMTAASAAPSPGTSPAASPASSPDQGASADKKDAKARAAETRRQRLHPAPAQSPGAETEKAGGSATAPLDATKGRDKKKEKGPIQQSAEAAGDSGRVADAATTPGKSGRGKGKSDRQLEPAVPSDTPAGAAAPTAPAEDQGVKQNRAVPDVSKPAADTDSASDTGKGRGRGNKPSRAAERPAADTAVKTPAAPQVRAADRPVIQKQQPVRKSGEGKRQPQQSAPSPGVSKKPATVVPQRGGPPAKGDKKKKDEDDSAEPRKPGRP